MNSKLILTDLFSPSKQVLPHQTALFVQGKGQAVAVYNSPQAALYAKEKLHGFEYPPGQRLIVKPDVNVHADLPM